MSRIYAAEIVPRSFLISDDIGADHNVTYQTDFTTATSGPTGSIQFEFCSNSPLIDDPCTPPDGLDVSQAVLHTQSGSIGFVISSLSNANNIILTRPPIPQPPTSVQYTFTNITNPTAGGSYYARIYTYATSDASGAFTDAGGTVFDILPSLAVSATVPPYLDFCLGGDISNTDCSTATIPFSDLGDLTPDVTSAAQSQFVVATNASNGYSVWTMGTPMTSGNNQLSAMSGGTSQKGTSQFGINLAANSSPAIGQDPSGPGAGQALAGYDVANHFRFSTGDPIATSSLPDNYRKYTVSYVVNIPHGQPGGVYSTTLTYVCLANF